MKFNEYKEKTIFITGAASGIGRAQTIAFIENGANVFGFDIDIDGLSDLSNRYLNHFTGIAGSVANQEHVRTAVEKALEKYPRIDVLLNTAGILDEYRPTLETNESLWDRIMNTNLKGLYLVTNEVLPHMLTNQSGVVVNMASIAGLVAGGGGAAYTASKHAIIGYTKQLDLDYAKHGIRANAIAPGAIKTPMNAADFTGAGEMAQWVASETPAGRWASPSEVAQLTLYLASEASSYVHGAVIPIDGGWTVK